MIGSFLNVVIARVPRMATVQDLPVGAWAPIYDLLTPVRSRCPACATVIPWYRNVPVLSWLLLRGRAACCRAPIPVRYLIVEILGLVIALVAFGVHGATWTAVPFAAFCYVLLAVAFVDLETGTVPTVLTVPFITGGLVVASFDSLTSINAVGAIYGAALGGIGLWFIRYVHRRISGRIGLGGGDILLMAALGAWLGPRVLLLAAAVSFICAGVYAVGLLSLRRRQRDDLAPLGPFFATGGISVLTLLDLDVLTFDAY